MANPFIYGKSCFAKVYIGNPAAPVVIWSKRIHIAEKATVNWDPVCGENRSRPQKTTDGYIVTVDTFDDGSSNNALNAFIISQSNDDAGNPPIGLGVGITFKSAGGIFVCTLGGIMVLDPLDYTIEGRAAANMQSCKFNAQYFNPTAAATI